MTVEFEASAGWTVEAAFWFSSDNPNITTKINVKSNNPSKGLYLIQAKAKTKRKVSDPITKAIINAANPKM